MSYIYDKNKALLVLAYPRLTGKDRAWIDSIRKEHDKLFYGIVDPHFTIVFPTFGITEDDFINEIKNKAEGISKFDFIIHCALMNNDRLSDYYHIFLSPDKGNSNIVKMHDHFYSGILRPTQRLDMDFFSHIAVGSCKDPEKCKSITDEINSLNVGINGSVDAVNIVGYGNRNIENILKIDLK